MHIVIWIGGACHVVTHRQWHCHRTRGILTVGLAFGHVLGGPDPQTRSALAIAILHVTLGIALILAQANFPEATLVGPAVLLYLLVNAVVAVLYLLWIKRRQSQFSNLGIPILADELQRVQLTKKGRK